MSVRYRSSASPQRFNPHPTRRSGATAARRRAAGLHLVSILTRPEGRVPLGIGGDGSSGQTDIVSILTRPEGRVPLADLVRQYPRGSPVSILTRPEGRVPRRGRVAGDTGVCVSILTRPEGRVPPLVPWFPSIEYRRCFNPHPTRRSGATLVWDAESEMLHGVFQSSPDPKVGCHKGVVGVARPVPRVSILTRPEGRVPRLPVPLGVSRAILVSILTRPEGRVPLGSALDAQVDAVVSILTRPEGRVPLAMSRFVVTGYPLFQSSPDPKVGCHTVIRERYEGGNIVSILTRPEGRVPPPPCTTPANPAWRFNPHPTRRSGATREVGWRSSAHASFNPHPTRRSGATPTSPTATSPACPRFNPHPTRRSGATLGDRPDQRQRHQVSILTRPEGRVPLQYVDNRRAVEIVSILTRPEGRVPLRPVRHTCRRSCQVSILTRPEGRVPLDSISIQQCAHRLSFNPHPTRRSGATNKTTKATPANIAFQSSPDPKVGCHCSSAQATTG